MIEAQPHGMAGRGADHAGETGHFGGQRRRQTADHVHLPPLERAHGKRRLHAQEQQAAHPGRTQVVLFVRRKQVAARRLVIRVQAIGTAADDIGLFDVLRIGQARIHMLRQDGHGAGQLRHEWRIHALQAHPHPPLAQVVHIVDGAQVEQRMRVLAQIRKRKHHVGRRDALAVMPARVGAQGELNGAVVGAFPPRAGQPRHQLASGVAPHQGVENQAGQRIAHAAAGMGIGRGQAEVALFIGDGAALDAWRGRSGQRLRAGAGKRQPAGKKKGQKQAKTGHQRS
ncbi:hypothetical protein JaAD80_27440 [Janthinobacterium sp. AD80]|nr:hypothetical protein JaAD80_27440 [Janthinobacterium sp. AD80]